MRRQRLAPIAAITLLLLAGGAGAAEQPAQHPPVLLLIDIQEFYFTGSLVLEGNEQASGTAAQVLTRFRALGWPVVHVQHLPAERDAPGQDVTFAFRIRPEVAPQPGEAVIGKHHANAFRETELLETLQQLAASRLVVVGMQTHMCVEAVTRAAADLGFQVTVVADACATRDLQFGETTVPAPQVHASTLASLHRSYGRVITAAELLEELPSPPSPTAQ